MKGITNCVKNTDITIDAALSTTSENPVQNKVITGAVNTINSKIDPLASSSNKLTSESTVDNKILASIVDSVSSTATDKSLSANMGKTLQEQISNLKNIGRFLAIWNADTGTVTKEPPVSPYTYKVGDYYRVGVSGTKNPKGSLTYVTGETNYVEGESLNVGDVVYCNSVTETETVWAKQSSSGGGTVQDVQLDGVSILNEGIANIFSQNIGNIGGNAVNVTGTVAISHGGTGAVTDVGARTNLEVGHTYLIGSGAYSFLSFAKTDTFPSSSYLIKYSATYIISGGGLATNGTVSKLGGVYLVVVGAQSTSNIKMDVIRLRSTDNDDNPLLSWGYFVDNGVVYYGLKCANSDTKNEFSATRITSNNGYVKDDNTAYQTLPSGIVNVSYNGVTYANTAGVASRSETAEYAYGYAPNGTIKTALDGKIDTAGTGLSKEGTTLSHSNSVNEQATQAVYPIKIDAQGHISAYGSAVTVPTKTSELENDSGFVTSSSSITGNAKTSSYPEGFSSRSTNATWGNQTGATVTSWNESDGGSIDFRKNNPTSGKLSVKVDGRFYGNEGNNPTMLMNYNSYWGMGDPDASTSAWIRTTSNGLLPYTSGNKGSGHSSLGTSSWYFSEAYIDKIYGGMGESFLTWGGQNFSGTFAPLDAAMVPWLGACRTMFAKAAGIVVEYSRDNGSTWTDYGATDANKVGLFSGTNPAFTIGKADSTYKATSAYKLRVTLNTSAANVYTVLNKFVIYVSTNGSTGCTCTIRARLQSNYSSGTDTWVTFADKASISGWSGYNVINTSGITTYGNTAGSQYGQIQFIFECTGGSTTYNGLNVYQIACFGGVGWTTPSTWASKGTLYSWDASQNAAFPAAVSATSFTENGTALANKYTQFYTGSSATKADNKTQTTTLRIGFASGVLNIWNS